MRAASDTVKPVMLELGGKNALIAYPDADVNTLIEGDYLDPISGFPGYKSLLCAVKRVAPSAPEPEEVTP